MEKHELKTLLEIKENPSTNQRSLSRKLNISLGLTNAILKNLIHRGWIKVNKLSGRKLLYLITPGGISRASHLAYERFLETQHFYQHAKNILTANFVKLYNNGKREAIIYGINQLTEITYLALLNSPLKLSYFSIINDDLSKKIFLGHQIFTISDFLNKYSLKPFPSPEKIVIFSTNNSDNLLQEIKKYESICKNIEIVDIENILKDAKQDRKIITES